ncbi:hypothetical protein ABFS82_09G000100 [Erythranthe guttata]
MVKNCGDYVHLQIAERIYCLRWSRLLGKKQVLFSLLRDILAFGGAGGRYSQYYMAYEDLRRSCVKFPKNLPRDAVPIFTPPVTTHPITTNNPKPSYGMPSSSSTRLDEAMAAGENLRFGLYTLITTFL